MAYPKKLVWDYYAENIADDFGIDNIGQPFYELTEGSDDTVTYRFATKPTSGTCYIKFDPDLI